MSISSSRPRSVRDHRCMDEISSGDRMLESLERHTAHLLLRRGCGHARQEAVPEDALGRSAVRLPLITRRLMESLTDPELSFPEGRLYYMLVNGRWHLR